MKSAIMMLLFLILCGCGNSSPGTVIEENPDPITFLALGDSYTIGEAVPEDQRWPLQLATALRKRGIKISPPMIIARTGWTTGDLLEAMDRQLDGEQYDLVSVLIGVNNQYQGKSITEYEKQLREILSRAISHSRTGKDGVFAVSIPDYGATPFGEGNREEIAAEIQVFNEVFRSVATEFGVDFYNITPISKRAATEPGLVAEDGLHPSGRMYELWVMHFLDQVVEKVGSL